MSQPKVNARVVKADTGESASSKQIHPDTFGDHYGELILEPPINMQELKDIAEYSTILQQCIDAYKTNIVGFGFHPEYTFDFNAKSVEQPQKTQAESEWVRLEEFVKYFSLDEGPETVFGYMIEDREKTGNGYLEVIRNGSDEPDELSYMDALYTRVCKKTEPVDVETLITRNGNPEKVTRRRTFRRYAQRISNKTIYFKEYGDPRIMDSRTGEFGDNVPDTYLANEVIHFKIGSAAYGKPRWLGHLLNAYGARKAEELNYMYFKNGRHMPAAIMVQNGMLSEESYTQMESYLKDMQGIEQAHKFLLLEVQGMETENDTGEEKLSNVKIDIKSLAEMVQQDALFLEYDATHRSKMRSAFRLPPLYTGEADEYNKATADTARKITEEQVFQPERSTIAGKMNTLILPDLEMNLVRLTMRGPDFRDPLEIAKVLTPFVNAQATSPNDLRDTLGKVLGKTLEEWPEEIFNRPMNKTSSAADPFNILKSKEPGHQVQLVTILKDLRDILVDKKDV
ncbi:phage portal protein [Alkalicoccobacillus plakortidis]|uniref:Phage portal protein n=1 Tax=Alkalicoccobacillus plakortidis TaxID=444060 RepID=A0ABT0XFS8_9BACI|nr:phage portal protein [Alkalicoccobacillus plakortidis]MCM2674084.1 phage portal protein [Alkalicoccobacillus plakortidis]